MRGWKGRRNKKHTNNPQEKAEDIANHEEKEREKRLAEEGKNSYEYFMGRWIQTYETVLPELVGNEFKDEENE